MYVITLYLSVDHLLNLKSSPRTKRTNCMSSTVTVTLLPWTAATCDLENNSTQYSSTATCSASNAFLRIFLQEKNKFPHSFWTISLTSLWNDSFGMSKFVVLWSRRISRRDTVPGLYRRLLKPVPPVPRVVGTAAVVILLFVLTILVSRFGVVVGSR